MYELPEVLIELVFEFIPPKEVFTNICRLNKYFYDICESKHFLNKLLVSFINTSLPISLSTTRCKKNFMKIFSKDHSRLLKFMGFATNGGVDDDLACYWVGNLFKEDSSSYCSRTNENIDTAAVLQSSQDKEFNHSQKKARAIAAKIIRENPLLSKIAGAKVAKEKNLLPMEERLFIDAWDENRMLIDISSMNYSEKVKQKVYNVLKKSQLKLSSLHKSNDKNYVEKELDHEKIKIFNRTAIIRKIVVSREGDYSCPLKTFVIFVSDYYEEIGTKGFQTFSSLYNYEDLLESKETDERFSISKHVVQPEYEYCLFRKSSYNFRPILWGKFLRSSISLLQIDLDDYCSGKYMYAKLINCENRMSEMHDHHEMTNIDCTYVCAYGFEFKF
ncbi:hypothetical protein SteCoe_11130 [Stentor coeruleus]|uniref:F-box domain-containing protein n=1 Tax=Stentor coeruleus TaxID=5963 RepID=A0A1R2CE07_9CILI|nr:hypothetical protein SteCoe_11130 [Stentor coeruleus]